MDMVTSTKTKMNIIRTNILTHETAAPTIAKITAANHCDIFGDVPDHE